MTLELPLTNRYEVVWSLEYVRGVILNGEKRLEILSEEENKIVSKGKDPSSLRATMERLQGMLDAIKKILDKWENTEDLTKKRDNIVAEVSVLMFIATSFSFLHHAGLVVMSMVDFFKNTVQTSLMSVESGQILTLSYLHRTLLVSSAWETAVVDLSRLLL